MSRKLSSLDPNQANALLDKSVTSTNGFPLTGKSRPRLNIIKTMFYNGEDNRAFQCYSAHTQSHTNAAH